MFYSTKTGQPPHCRKEVPTPFNPPSTSPILLLRQDAPLNFDLLLSGGRKTPIPLTQWASCWSSWLIIIIWISKAYLDNTSFECQIAEGSWGRLEDACMWKNHTGLIVYYCIFKIQLGTHINTHTRTVYLMLRTWFHFSADQLQDKPCPSSFDPCPVSCFQEISLSRWTQSSITNSLKDNAEQTKTAWYKGRHHLQDSALSAWAQVLQKVSWNQWLHQFANLQLCLKSAKCFISAGRLPGQLSPGNPHATGPLRDEGWLGRESGGSYVTETTAGTASQRFPGGILGTLGPSMCMCVRRKGM